MDKLVSIIVNCYNGEKYLFECLSSILNQKYTNWEVIFGIINRQIKVKKFLIDFKTKMKDLSIFVHINMYHCMREEI